MLGRTYEREVCSAARALEIVGERWSLLILRNAMFAGMTRFTDFEKSLGIAPNVLTARLEHFVQAGIMATAAGLTGSHTYHLTEQGVGLKRVIIALTAWGDRWAAPDGPPIRYEHEGCGGQVRQELYCEKCAEKLLPEAVVARKTAVMARLQARRMARQGRKK